MSKKTLEQYQVAQKRFSDLFFKSEDLSEQERIEKHKIFSLALHSEVSSLADAVHYRDHRPIKSETERQNMLYEIVDIFRYQLAILNLWDVSPEEFQDAYDSRNSFLWDRETRGIQNWNGQPVVVVDIDDVLARFRQGFFTWINENFGVKFNIEDPSYYIKERVGKVSNEEAFSLFIKSGGIRKLEVNPLMIETLRNLRKSGIWIQLLTARPVENLKCLYDTYYWLDEMCVPYDSISMSSEKYRWLIDKEFFRQKKIICAIDDSPKHSAEFAQHDIITFVPKRGYNKDVWNLTNIKTFDWNKERIDEKIKNLL